MKPEDILLKQGDEKASVEVSKCQSCKTAEAAPLHVCPFLSDVHNDDESKCNCCDECATNCAMEI